jgi:hypothetical protein
MLVSNIKVHVEFNKSSFFHSTDVGYTIRLGYESAKYLFYQGLYNINLINHLTNKVLKVNKITNTKHVSIKH